VILQGLVPLLVSVSARAIGLVSGGWCRSRTYRSPTCCTHSTADQGTLAATCQAADCSATSPADESAAQCPITCIVGASTSGETRAGCSNQKYFPHAWPPFDGLLGKRIASAVVPRHWPTTCHNLSAGISRRTINSVLRLSDLYNRSHIYSPLSPRRPRRIGVTETAARSRFGRSRVQPGSRCVTGLSVSGFAGLAALLPLRHALSMVSCRWGHNGRRSSIPVDCRS
jgi:hypothetical protein